MQNCAVISVYLAGLLQGIAIVAFPALSTIFTSQAEFNLTSTEYGSLFIPQVICSIFFALFSRKLYCAYGLSRIFLVGLLANCISMSLLSISSLYMTQEIAYVLLLCSTFFLGIGYGLTVPAINTMAALLYPHTIDFAILILNALLGIGTALAPLLVCIFVKLWFWWQLPIVLSLFLISLFFVSSDVDFPHPHKENENDRASLPRKFYVFILFAFCYGMIETLNGNWASLFMTNTIKASSQIAGIALFAFWTMVTFGRLFFASVEKFFSESKAFRTLPFFIAFASLCLTILPQERSFTGILAFGLQGFGCSALLPLTISFSQSQFKKHINSVAGIILAFYLAGYGVSAFFVGPLQDDFGISLRMIFAIGIAISLSLGLLSFFITKVQSGEPE